MDWQTSEDTVAARPVTDADARALVGKPPASGAWREGDPVGERRFAGIGTLTTETGARIPGVRIAYEAWGRLDPDRGNAVLVLHALTGDAMWLDRARRFAVHAVKQVRRERAAIGHGRYTLFTGDIGVALYLRACLDEDPAFPIIDVL